MVDKYVMKQIHLSKNVTLYAGHVHSPRKNVYIVVIDVLLLTKKVPVFQRDNLT